MGTYVSKDGGVDDDHFAFNPSQFGFSSSLRFLADDDYALDDDDEGLNGEEDDDVEDKVI